MDNTYATGNYPASTTGYSKNIYYPDKTSTASVHIGTSPDVTIKNSEISGSFSTTNLTSSSNTYYYNWGTSNISVTASDLTSSYVEVYDLS